ncbi:MAG: von Willebrand factor type A domain-containing protein [Chitinophagaceae bacterium]
MLKLTTYLLLTFLSVQLCAQNYIRGEVRDEKNQPLQNVKILVHSNKMFFFSGESGGFYIGNIAPLDSLTFSLSGYENKCTKIRSGQYQSVNLRFLPSNINSQKPKLISITRDIEQKSFRNFFFQDESYSNLIENDFIKAQKYPNTGFAIHVDKAAYSNIRRFVNQKSIVPKDAVRIEEMLNYFNFNYKEPEGNAVFRVESQLSSCPWDVSHQLLYLNVNARKIDLEKVPASNFVFLIDVSGSMDMPNRLPLLKAAFQLLVKNLREKDTVSIVVYGGSVGIWLQPTGGAEKQKIIKAIEELTPGGSTPGEAAVRTAYNLARRTFIEGGNNRIILATDGDFNVGQTSEKELEDLILRERQSGVHLTCLGVGMGNYKDSKIEVLARRGNGNFAYLDDLREAEKVLVTELTQTLYTVAHNVYLNLKFNPAMVKEYRLIGYDNKKNIASDSTSELEGGDVGSGNSITAIFELVPTEHNAFSTESPIAGDIGKLDLNYHLPNNSILQKMTYTCTRNYKEFATLSNELKFASAIAMFGLKLRNSKYISDASWNDIVIIANESMNKEDYLQTEFVLLVDKAKKIYSKRKKKDED